MTLPLDVERPMLAVPHADLRLPDGRRLRRWAEGDPRRPIKLPESILDHDGWDGPQRLIVIVTIDDTPHGPLLHASVSYQDRDPSWADLKAVRYLIFPRDVDVMCMLPRDGQYLAGVAPIKDGRGRTVARGAPGGADSHVFHLSQTPVGWGML